MTEEAMRHVADLQDLRSARATINRLAEENRELRLKVARLEGGSASVTLR